jgi:hypothetical protein
MQERLEHAIAQFEDPAERDFLATLSEQLKREGARADRSRPGCG